MAAGALPPDLPEDDRSYPHRPIVGVGVVVVRGRSVLVVQRGREPGLGEWSIPGGAVEIGETVREAAAREVAEECGIDVDIGEVVDVLDRVFRDEEGRVRYHFVIIDFAGSYRSGTLRADSDVLDARWVAEDALPQSGLPAITLAVVQKALARLNGP